MVLALVLGGSGTAVASPTFGYADGPYMGTLATTAASRTADSGGTTARVLVDWSYIQPTKTAAPSTWKWEVVDSYLTALAQSGVRPLLLINHTPSWARSALDLCSTVYCPPSPGALTSFQTFVAEVVKRYTGRVAGGFDASPIGVEIWNEENLSSSWATATGPDPVRYAQLLRVGYDGVRSVDAALPVVLGGLSNSSTRSGALSITDFMSRFYVAGGAPFDEFAIHQYAASTAVDYGATMTSAITTAQHALRGADVGKPIDITETNIFRPAGFPETLLGPAILQLYDAAAAFPQVKHVFVFRLVSDSGPQPYGVLWSNWQPRQAYCDLKARLNPGTCVVGLPISTPTTSTCSKTALQALLTGPCPSSSATPSTCTPSVLDKLLGRNPCPAVSTRSFKASRRTSAPSLSLAAVRARFKKLMRLTRGG